MNINEIRPKAQKVGEVVGQLAAQSINVTQTTVKETKANSKSFAIGVVKGFLTARTAYLIKQAQDQVPEAPKTDVPAV